MERVDEPYATILRNLLELLRERFGDDLYSLVLYGSVARREQRPDSDVDLLLIVRGLPREITRRIEIFMELEEKLNLEKYMDQGYYITLSPIIKTPEEASRTSPLYFDMVQDAVILYDRDSFFSGILDRLRKKMEELGAERVRMGRMWYWRFNKYRPGDKVEL
ncbi:nucleotidyltransferase domain-containing protein [Metallosphaera javensis (ex Sakai et al. 2022)]|uniref:nucleotidyltransferase domain-containing protein n=1 Tax=Metallosphaera javensis (ex Sakai et al. 2022) TaxID=2775498 RepID=UPI00258CE5D5|nr:MAG: DNA polymerase [Metallosphaera javensis (ex Sakai et al. 2022)]